MTDDDIYARLAAPFEVHHKDPRGLEYLTGNQVVGRLNEVLGPGRWTFTVKEHGYDEESDEIWVLGRFTAHIDVPEPFGDVCREQFGSQKHNRRKADINGRGAILDYGFDLKGASTDALKKCATLIGVGLYLSEKEGGIPQDLPGLPVVPAGKGTSPPAFSPSEAPAFRCIECKTPIMTQTGEPIDQSHVDIIIKRFGKLVCKEHRKFEVKA